MKKWLYKCNQLTRKIKIKIKMKAKDIKKLPKIIKINKVKILKYEHFLFWFYLKLILIL